MHHKTYEKREAILAGITVFMILEFLTFFIYVNAIAAQKGEIFEGLKRTTNVIQTLIDTKRHQELNSLDQENTILYSEQISPLYNALISDSTIEFIYTMIQIDTTIHFILDPTPSTSLDQHGAENKSHVMDKYANPSEELKQCFKSKETVITQNVYYDEWGGHISCFSPLFNHKKFIGVIRIDISTTTFNNRLQPIKKATQRAMVTIFFIAYLSGLIIWFLRRVYKTLSLSK